MPITRAKKEELVAEYKKHIAGSPAIVFTNFRGTKVSQLNSLRARMAGTDSHYAVVKNTLLRIALEESGRPAPETLLNGPNGVVFVGEDIGRSVTALKEWIRVEKIVEINGALLESSVLDATGADALSDLPTKEQALASVLGAINAPASTLVRMVNAPLASLARVINAHVEKQQEAA